METIIGFAAGYLVGSKEGKAGYERLKASVRAIAKSREARRIAADAASLAGMLARQASARGIGASATGVAELVMRRMNETGFAKRDKD
ncbi:MAG TPA: hypothetical protein VFI65_12655 [Streptosporangiaceae bacterium]|nr:hypothetical protein [Streptosporangiaceae bacterium]